MSSLDEKIQPEAPRSTNNRQAVKTQSNDHVDHSLCAADSVVVGAEMCSCHPQKSARHHIPCACGMKAPEHNLALPCWAFASPHGCLASPELVQCIEHRKCHVTAESKSFALGVLLGLIGGVLLSLGFRCWNTHCP
jgi:hypothetical protein